MARGITLVDGIGPIVGFMVANAAHQVYEAMEDGRAEVEAYAQSNAPWSDITGQARNGLVADVRLEGGEVVLELAHTVDYGRWLELIQDGAFAIILPTLELLGPHIIQDAGGAVLHTGRGLA